MLRRRQKAFLRRLILYATAAISITFTCLLSHNAFQQLFIQTHGFTYIPQLPYAEWITEKIVNPFPYTFTLNPSRTRSFYDTDLLVAVMTTGSNHALRQAIRETWGSYSHNVTHKTSLLFFIGRSNETGLDRKKSNIQHIIDNEYSIHRDIVQSEFIDSYENLTLKTMSILQWVNSYCPQVKFLVKADDDTYVNVPLLHRTMEIYNRQQGGKAFILGNLHYFEEPNRNQDSKWFASTDAYPYAVYPNFVSGPMYAMNSAAVRLLLQAALRTRMFRLEDVYITGICAHKANVTRIGSKTIFNFKLNLYGNELPFDPRTLSAHHYTPEEMAEIHAQLYNVSYLSEKFLVQTSSSSSS